MERHTDSEGNFRSLKDAWLYNEDQIPADLGPGSPDPANYSVDQIDEYYADGFPSGVQACRGGRR